MINDRHRWSANKIPQSVLLITALAGWSGPGALRAAQVQGGAAIAAARKAAGTSPRTAEKRTPSKPAMKPAEGASRDPFKLPAPIEKTGSENLVGSVQGPEILGPVPAGSRGLVIGQLKLEGIVVLGKNNPKMIAVLSNPANRAYFLHENDPLYNGVVTKITPDSVYFREDVKDASGTVTSHEVIKKLPPASGEKK